MIRSYRGILPKVAPSAYIDPSAQVIGDVVVGERSSIWPNATVRGDVNYIRIGEETNVQDNSVLHVEHEIHPLLLGNRVTVGGSGVGTSFHCSVSTPIGFSHSQAFIVVSFNNGCR